MSSGMRTLLVGIVAIALVVGVLFATGVIGGDDGAEDKAVKFVPTDLSK